MDASNSTAATSQPGQQPTKTIYISLTLIGLVVGWIVCTLTSGASSQNFRVAFAGASVEIEAEGMEIEHEDLLNKIYGEDFARAGLLGWLEQRDIFPVSDPSLVAASYGRKWVTAREGGGVSWE